MRMMLASCYAPVLLLAIVGPFILGPLWLLPLISGISLFSTRATVLRRRLLIGSVTLFLIWSVGGSFLVLVDERERERLAVWLWFVLIAAIPTVLIWLHTWLSRRAVSASAGSVASRWNHPITTMIVGIALWALAAFGIVKLPELLWP